MKSIILLVVKSPKIPPWPRAQLLRPVLEGRDVLAVMPRGAKRAVGKIHAFDIYPLGKLT